MAINKLFEGGGYIYDPSLPSVDVDEDTQQLFIRATKEQHTKIRELLVKMGETGLKRVAAGDKGNSRVVPFQGDPRATLREIERIWPQLRDNPIQIADPKQAQPAKPAEPAKDAVTPPQQTPKPATETPIAPAKETPKTEPEKTPAKETPKAEPEKVPAKEPPKAEPEKKPVEEPPKAEPEKKPVEEPPKAEPEKKPVEEPPKVEPEKKPAEEPPKAEPEKKPAEKAASSSVQRRRWRIQLVGLEQDAGAQPEPTKAAPAETPKAAPPEQTPAPKAAPAEPKPTEPKPAGKPPIVLIPGEGSITIQSDDPEAIEQMESLLRSLSPKIDFRDRNVEVFTLRYTDAISLADRLQELFRQMTPRYRRGGASQTMIVGDERLNTIVVRGSRTDRATISSLIEVLDSAAVTEDIATNQPAMVAVHNTSAARIEQMVRDVFQAQLTLTGRGRTHEGRLAPQITVDEMTNSLVVMAQEPLRTQVTQLIQTLDQSAGEESANTLKLIPLKNTNAERVQKALDATIERSHRRRHQ
jgi:hypothetical protein